MTLSPLSEDPSSSPWKTCPHTDPSAFSAGAPLIPWLVLKESHGPPRPAIPTKTRSYWIKITTVNLPGPWLGHGMPRELVTCYFWVSVRVFLNEMSIWIRSLSRADCPSQCGWASSNPLWAWREQEGRGRKNCLSLPDWWAGTSVFSPQTWTGTYIGPLVLRPLSLDLNYIPSYPGPPAYRPWDFSASIIVWACPL